MVSFINTHTDSKVRLICCKSHQLPTGWGVTPSEMKPVSVGFLINWKPVLCTRYWRILAKNPWRKGQCGRLYIFPCWVNKMMLYYLFCSKQYPKHKHTQKAKSKHIRLLVPVTSLHSVCGLYTIRHNRTNSLSVSAAAPLLYMALHWCHWEHLPSLLFLLTLFFSHVPLCLGARYSTETQRAVPSNYRSLSSGLCCTFTRRLACHLPWGGKPCACQPWDLMWDFC